jgi:hypothetical protein
LKPTRRMSASRKARATAEMGLSSSRGDTIVRTRLLPYQLRIEPERRDSSLFTWRYIPEQTSPSVVREILQ